MAQDNASLNLQVTELEALEKEYEKLKKQKAKGRKSKSSVSREDEANDDVKAAIKTFVRDVMFRTVKFAVPGDSLNAASTQVWNGIKDKLKLDKGPNAITLEDFAEIYGGSILKELSARRQYSQTRCKLAADGTELVYCFHFVYFTLNLGSLLTF